MSNDIDPRDFGRLEAEVAALTELVKRQSEILAKQNTRLDEIQATLSEAKGGWKMMMYFSGVAASLGALGAWALEHLVWK